MKNITEKPTEYGPVIYATGCTNLGITLIGGIWKLWEQEGFPLEMSHLVCRENGWAVDWSECMADACTTNNGPALMKHLEAFLTGETIHDLKLGFMHALNLGKTYDQIAAEKMKNGRAFANFSREALRFSESIGASTKNNRSTASAPCVRSNQNIKNEN